MRAKLYDMSLMKAAICCNPRIIHTSTGDGEHRSSTEQRLSVLCFMRIQEQAIFFVDIFWTESVFVTQLS
jgi:hypothetical protein